MANPYHKGSDATVQSARVETPRAIDLSVAAKRAVAQSESNLHWSRRNVQQLVEDVQFATHLDTCRWSSDFARAAAQPLPAYSHGKSYLCPMLREEPVDPLHTFSCVSLVFYTLYISHADGCT